MSSMMDIIFILLIFVMISISFQKNIQTLEMELPHAKGSSSEIEKEQIQISVYNSGKIFVNQKEQTWDSLEKSIKEIQTPRSIVLLNIEKQTPYEKFIQISELLKKMQISKIELGVTQ